MSSPRASREFSELYSEHEKVLDRALTDLVLPFVIPCDVGRESEACDRVRQAALELRAPQVLGKRSSERASFWQLAEELPNSAGINKLSGALRDVLDLQSGWLSVLSVTECAVPFLRAIRYVTYIDHVRTSFALPIERAFVVVSQAAVGALVLRLDWSHSDRPISAVELTDKLSRTTTYGASKWFLDAEALSVYGKGQALNLGLQNALGVEVSQALEERVELTTIARSLLGAGQPIVRNVADSFDEGAPGEVMGVDVSVVADRGLLAGAGRSPSADAFARSIAVTFVGDNALCFSFVRWAKEHASACERDLDRDDYGSAWSRGAEPSQKFPAPEERSGDRVLRTRRGRDIYVAREGTALVVCDPDADGFTRGGHIVARSMGVYAWLFRMAVLERVALARIDSRISRQLIEISDAKVLVTKQARSRLIDVSLATTRVAAGLVTADGGAITDYATYLHALRDVMGTDEALAEVRAECADAARLAELAYRYAADERAGARALAEERFQQTVAFFGIIGVVFGSVGGFMGMNVLDPSMFGDNEVKGSIPIAIAILCFCCVVSGTAVWTLRYGSAFRDWISTGSDP